MNELNNFKIVWESPNYSVYKNNQFLFSTSNVNFIFEFISQNSSNISFIKKIAFLEYDQDEEDWTELPF